MTWVRVAIGTVLLFFWLPVPADGQQSDSPDATAPVHQDTRTQYPAFLINSYFSVNVGYIEYAFSDRPLLESGFHAGSAMATGSGFHGGRRERPGHADGGVFVLSLL
jgi:hypothetical protein